MKKYKIWFFVLLGILLFSRLSLALANYIVDPFNVFDSNVLKISSRAQNVRAVKIRHLSKAHKNYNSYMFGSSRVGTIHPDALNKYIPGAKFYNFWVSDGNMLEHVLHLRYFLKQGYEVRNTFVLVDLDIFVTSTDPEQGDYVTKLAPDVSGMPPLKFYMDYLSVIPYENIRKKLALNYYGIDRYTIDFEKTGLRLKSYEDKLIEQDQLKYIRQVSNLNINRADRTVSPGTEALDNTLEALRTLVSICSENGINLIVATMPHNYNKLNQLDTESVMHYPREISKIIDFWNFSTYNRITLDNRYYYEWSHFRPIVGEMMMARMFDDDTIEGPSDFGFHVNSSNVESHIKEISRGFRAADERYR